MTPAAGRHGLHLGWSHPKRLAFQMCLARAVSGPERFKGGTCSFGARTDVRRTYAYPGLSRADSSGRYAVGAHIIARIARWWQAASVTGLWRYANEIARPVHYLFFTLGGERTS
jgi:hypothetical protein